MPIPLHMRDRIFQVMDADLEDLKNSIAALRRQLAKESRFERFDNSDPISPVVQEEIQQIAPVSSLRSEITSVACQTSEFKASFHKKESDFHPDQIINVDQSAIDDMLNKEEIVDPVSKSYDTATVDYSLESTPYVARQKSLKNRIV